MLTLAKVDPNQARVQAGQALSDQGGSNPPVGTNFPRDSVQLIDELR